MNHNDGKKMDMMEAAKMRPMDDESAAMVSGGVGVKPVWTVCKTCGKRTEGLLIECACGSNDVEHLWEVDGKISPMGRIARG